MRDINAEHPAVRQHDLAAAIPFAADPAAQAGFKGSLNSLGQGRPRGEEVRRLCLLDRERKPTAPDLPQTIAKMRYPTPGGVAIPGLDPGSAIALLSLLVP